MVVCCKARTCGKASSATSESETAVSRSASADECSAGRNEVKVNLAVFVKQRHCVYQDVDTEFWGGSLEIGIRIC